MIKVKRDEKIGWGSSFFEIFSGLVLTLRNLFQDPIAETHPTIEYPEVKRPYSSRFRGAHVLFKRDDGRPRCTACMMCPTACPAECIHIVAADHPDPRIEKYPVRFDIDLLRCVMCGYCVDACPEGAIGMMQEYDLGVYERKDSIYDIEMLMNRPSLKTSPVGYGTIRRDDRLEALPTVGERMPRPSGETRGPGAKGRLPDREPGEELTERGANRARLHRPSITRPTP